MLPRILKIYTWVISAVIVLTLGYALYAWCSELTLQAYLAVFYAVIFVIILMATRWFLKRNIRDNSKNKTKR
jgi:membrane protein DedA with SNARE-associated domain